MPFVDPTAAQSPITHFYHYQSYCRKYFTDMLREEMLHFSHPHKVNDPWDCKPWFDYGPMLADRQQREAMIATFRSLPVPDILQDLLRPEFDNLVRTDDTFMIGALEKFTRGLERELSTRRIYCVTQFSDKTLMWSHYASNHRGICLEFANNNPLIRHARAVHYKKTYPVFTPQSYGPGKDANALELILTKAMDWCYEREWRIIASDLEGPMKLHNHDFVKLPTGALSAIIIGCENTEHAEIIEITRAHQPHVRIKWAVRMPNVFNLAISDEPDRDTR
jgi:hypothetical protein